MAEQGSPRADDELRARLERLAGGLPEVMVEAGQHSAFRVRNKTFGYYLDDHHGDGIVALCVKAAPGAQQALVGAQPERYLVPAYLGAKGWVSLRLDLGEPDWAEIEELLLEGYRLVAPKTLAAKITGGPAGR
ncbi:MmcQ/YjbR family DNA-binding protein [Crossiella sp. CA198]|uniref:MmcQ/YjbR family DNA-binding protein n=1 Tax=Crossiella sp. CA198 TaxID=3455607 RepID=UPI003F8D072D